MAAEPTTPTKEQGGVSSAASEDGVSLELSPPFQSTAYLLPISTMWAQRNLYRNTNMNAIQDTFEDAPDITPRPRAKSPESTRSLTQRRTSSVSVADRIKALNGGDGAAEISGSPRKNSDASDAKLKVNGHAAEGEKRISMSELSDVNLGDGKLARMPIAYGSHSDAATALKCHCGANKQI